MKDLAFKTNINCANCVRAVKGFLEEVEGIEQWEVNTTHPDKILRVKGITIKEADIVEAVEEAGFNIEIRP